MHELLEESAQPDAQGGLDRERALLALNCLIEVARAAAVAGHGEAWAVRTLDALAPGNAHLSLWRRWLPLRCHSPPPTETTP